MAEPEDPLHDESAPDTVFGEIAFVTRWLTKQNSYFVLLFSILAFLGYLAAYGIPAGIKQIQTGYETLHAEFRQDAAAQQVAAERRQDLLLERADKAHTEALSLHGKAFLEQINSQRAAYLDHVAKFDTRLLEALEKIDKARTTKSTE